MVKLSLVLTRCLDCEAGLLFGSSFPYRLRFPRCGYLGVGKLCLGFKISQVRPSWLGLWTWVRLVAFPGDRLGSREALP